MRIANQWNDYRILDTSGQEKLEQWGNVTLIRPDPQIIWKTPKEHGMWNLYKFLCNSCFSWFLIGILFFFNKIRTFY